MRLHFLLLILQTLVPLLLFLHSRLQVVKDIFQLLLPGQQANSHLFGLSKQLRLRVELLGQDVLLFNDLKKGRDPKQMLCSFFTRSVMLLQSTVLAQQTSNFTS